MKNAQTIIINGLEVTGSIDDLRNLLGISVENSMPEKPAKKAKAPKAPKAPKPKAPKAEEPKAEKPEEPKGPVYSKGGLLLQWNDEIAAKGKEKAAITRAYNALTKQGFVVTRKRVGSWIEIFRAKGEDGEYQDNMTAKEFKAAKLDSGWEFIKGAWKYPYLLKEYEDNFRPEQA